MRIFIRTSAWIALVAASLVGVAAWSRAAPVSGPWTNAFGQGDGPITGANTASPTVGNGTADSAVGEMFDSPFTPITLANDGDKIRFTGSVTLSGTVNSPASSGTPRTQFRFGLFNADSDDLGWVGYYMSNRHGAAGSPAGTLARKPVGNTSAYLSTSGQNSLATLAGDGTAASLFHDATYTMNMTIERNAASGFMISATLLGSNGFTQSLSAVDSTASTSGTFSFNSLGFLLGDNLGVDQAAFHDLDVTFVPAVAPLTLQVLVAGPDAGAMRLLNSGPQGLNLDYYEIRSLSGSLDPAGWLSLDDQDPAAPPLGWGEAGGVNSGLLSEALISGSTPLAPAAALVLGRSFSGFANDLQLFFGVEDGPLAAGAVQYVLPGDFDGNGDVNAADLALWNQNAGHADADFDGDSDGNDFLMWQRNLGAAMSTPVAGAVPEPAAVLLLFFGGMAVSVARRSRQLEWVYHAVAPPAESGLAANFSSVASFSFMPRYCFVLLAAVLSFAAYAYPLSSAEAADPSVPTYNRDIRPILSDRCFVCHGPDSGHREADLRLDTEAGAHESVIVPGKADESELINRVISDDPDVRMPPPDSKKSPLDEQQIELLKKWIDAGAKYELHWAYIPPKRSPVPKVKHESIARNDIDRFVLARIEAQNLEPSLEADRATLARRLYFDLTGLPPTPVEIDAFVADKRPDAYERLVDRLLASESYGERMASWWFDLVRFASTVGYHGDQEHAVTPYRDYVIKSFNDNLPFSRFTIEQLAGDLLPNPTMWQLVASCYNRLLQTTHEGGAQDKEYRAKYLADRVRNFSETWLAGSMGCSECHDHKFDPYTQDDFYGLGAFFADVDQYGSFVPVARNTTPTERPPEMLAWTLPVYRDIEKIDARIAELEESLVGNLDVDWIKRRDELLTLRRQRVDLEAKFERVMITKAVEPREIHILPRGNWMDDSGQIVHPHVPHFLKQLDTQGRRANRLDLANWLVSKDNSLTARVVANRLWQRYFGIGLSKGLLDMGSQGEWPANQELLDWLACEFMDSGWDVKHLVRLMVTTSAYRQSSLPRKDLDVVDPDNRLVARQSRFRLDAEQIRDNALAVSGLLVQQVGGGVSRPYQPAGYYAPLNFPEREYEPTLDANQFRRSVYVHWQRQYLHPWLLAFDAPTREECTAQRPISNTPTAALVLLNDPSFVEAARALAERTLAASAANNEQRIQWIWRTVAGRQPSADEQSLLEKLLAKHRKHYAEQADAANQLVAVGISKRDDDENTSELAAWTSVARALLNLNETISRN